ncbi:MAG: TetR/AcrR family transcriptional regulator [Lachnospiraceae bacterium]|nr:TetR/AcrR family transcriptional regulator [Lachnospiraceae bacterium]
MRNGTYMENADIMDNMDNRTRLLRCANELFYEKGYDAVGVQEIVARAGLTKPTLYYYFGSKMGLLEALVAERFERLRGMYQALKERSRQKDLRIEEALYWLADIFCGFFEQDRHFYMLMMALFYSARGNEAYQTIQPYMVEFYGMVVQVFDRAADQLGNMNGRQRQFAIGFVGTISSYFLLHYEHDPAEQERVDRQQIAALVKQFMYGIFS